MPLGDQQSHFATLPISCAIVYVAGGKYVLTGAGAPDGGISVSATVPPRGEDEGGREGRTPHTNWKLRTLMPLKNKRFLGKKLP